ncbi:MAG: hypothetical protein HY077_15560 [Elusimicrobia bacterium]|nr:hypothetical protein [Elusimicrobiota bacterium]
MTMPLALLLWLPNPLSAQTPAPTPVPYSGYVVKVDSSVVYLDLAAQNGASAGQAFTVYTEGEELKHPVTGQSLGRLENKVAEGSIKEVLPMYSIGALSSPAEVKAGMRARLGSKPLPPAPPPSQTAAGAAPGALSGRAPRWKSPSVDFQATGMAISDFRGDKALQVALSESNKVSLYPYPFEDAKKPLTVFNHPGVNVKIINLEAADLNGDGKAELFAALYNETFTRFETMILQFDGKELQKIGEVPGVIRSYQEIDGKRVLAVQQLNDDQTFPFNGIYPLVFKDGKYEAGKPSIRFKRVDFLFDFTTADLDGRAVLYLTSTNHLRAQFDNGHYVKTNDPVGQTPLRVRWPPISAGRLLEFHPPMPVGYDAKKKAAIYVAHNISMLGSLSEPFGLFSRGEILRKSWNGLALEDDWKADIGGYCAGLSLANPPGKAAELAAAVVGTSGKSSIWVYDP